MSQPVFEHGQRHAVPTSHRHNHPTVMHTAVSTSHRHNHLTVMHTAVSRSHRHNHPTVMHTAVSTSHRHNHPTAMHTAVSTSHRHNHPTVMHTAVSRSIARLRCLFLRLRQTADLAFPNSSAWSAWLEDQTVREALRQANLRGLSWTRGYLQQIFTTNVCCALREVRTKLSDFD